MGYFFFLRLRQDKHEPAKRFVSQVSNDCAQGGYVLDHHEPNAERVQERAQGFMAYSPDLSKAQEFRSVPIRKAATALIFKQSKKGAASSWGRGNLAFVFIALSPF